MFGKWCIMNKQPEVFETQHDFLKHLTYQLYSVKREQINYTIHKSNNTK